ncbi:MAG: hypothetical protein M3R13_10415 [Armatimonadota bacterium]|nr:hypothetical protein [Armatimonadota bacterium]
MVIQFKDISNLHTTRIVADIAGDFEMLRAGTLTPEEFADAVQERVHPDRVEPARVPMSSIAEQRRPGASLVFGVRWDSWLYDYAQALSAWLQDQVRHSRDVVEFREQYLTKRELVSEEDIWIYLLELVRQDGAPGQGDVEMVSFRVGFGEGMESLEIPKVSTGELGDLIKITKLITRGFRASQGWALFAVLIDSLEMQYVPYRVRFLDGKFNFTKRIVLELDPVMTAKDVRDLYIKVRDRVAPRGKSISNQKLRLVGHAARFSELPWDDLRAEWNVHNRDAPEWQYAHAPPVTGHLNDSEALKVLEGWARQHSSSRNSFRRDVLAACKWVIGSLPPRRPRKVVPKPPTQEEMKKYAKELKQRRRQKSKATGKGEKNV